MLDHALPKREAHDDVVGVVQVHQQSPSTFIPFLLMWSKVTYKELGLGLIP